MIQTKTIPNDEDGPIAVCTGTQHFPIPSVWEQNEKKILQGVCTHPDQFDKC